MMESAKLPEEVTAVAESGMVFKAGQVVSGGDIEKRKKMDIQELNPILKVVSVEWQGMKDGFPNIRFVVTDGVSEAVMRPSKRRGYKQLRAFFSKRGYYRRGMLNKGRVFQLIDYTTKLVEEEATIMVERVKCTRLPSRKVEVFLLD